MVSQAHQQSLFDLEPANLVPAQIGRAGVSAIFARQILTKAGGSLRWFDYSLNPYIGCGFGCSYCFASFFQPDEERFNSWGKWIEVKDNAVELLKRHRHLKDAKIFMSSATDPYQPLEAKVGLTRRLVEVMSDPLRQPRLVVQTRGPLVTRDIDLLKRFRNVRVNMSITTGTDAIRRRFEPSCASIERRLEAIKEVKMAGLKTSVCICPMLPVEDPEAFALRLKAVNADHYVAAFFHSTDRAFAANTRENAWLLSKEYGWDKDAFKATVARMQKVLPQLNNTGGFGPA
ncbi:MAG TPA: radical SAM protein [Fimbriimonadaceae bacterium]|jgi:DNA repair photolyase